MIFKGLPRKTASDENYVVKRLILLNIQNMMDINKILLQWFTVYGF